MVINYGSYDIKSYTTILYYYRSTIYFNHKTNDQRKLQCRCFDNYKECEEYCELKNKKLLHLFLDRFNKDIVNYYKEGYNLILSRYHQQ